MPIKEITDETFNEKVMKSSKPFCLKFEADWCGPCKALTPIVEEISNEMTGIDFGAMNIDNQPNTPTKFGVRGIPTCILVVNGELKSTKVGMTNKSEFSAWLKENTQFKLNTAPARYSEPVINKISPFFKSTDFIASIILGWY